MRSSPQVTFEAAISKMSFLSSSGTGGRPLGRDFQRQNKRNPFRCQRMSVSGFTTMRAFFQSKILVSAAIVNRVALSVRRGACSRSTKKVSCFRRKRFSAARALWERGRLRTNAMASRTMGTIFERSRKSEPFHVQNDDDPVVVPVGAKQPILAGLSRGINAGSSFCGPQGRHQGSPHRSWDRRHYAELRAEVAEWHLGVFYRFCQRGSPTSLASSTAPRTRQR